MKNFKCIGGACEDTCCKGWQVPIDQKTYEKYLSVRHTELETMFKLHIRCNGNNAENSNQYANIILTDEKSCPFLDEAGWCVIQKNLGEEYLSVTCSSYPKIHNIIDKKAERAGLLSCPELARKALLQREGISFEKMVTGYSYKDVVVGILETKQQDENQLNAYFWDLRIAGLGILQNRKYPIDSRMYLLGLFLENVNALSSHNELNNLGALISTFEEMMAKNEFDESLAEIEFDLALQIEMLQTMMMIKQDVGIVGVRYLNCLNETIRGLNLSGGKEAYSMLPLLQYNNFLHEHEYILENYLVNEFFREMMPLGLYKSVWDSFVLLCIMFNLIKMHLLGIGLYREVLNEDTAIELIQSLSKEISHNEKLKELLLEAIQKDGVNTLYHMSKLVKNPTISV